MVPYLVSDSMRSPSRRLRLDRVVWDSAEFSNPEGDKGEGVGVECGSFSYVC